MAPSIVEESTPAPETIVVKQLPTETVEVKEEEKQPEPVAEPVAEPVVEEAPAATEPIAQAEPAATEPIAGNVHVDEFHLHTGHKEPLKLSGALDKYESFDVTPVIGREFVDTDLAELLRAPNSDELIRDLAITSKLFTFSNLMTQGASTFSNLDMILTPRF